MGQLKQSSWVYARCQNLRVQLGQKSSKRMQKSDNVDHQLVLPQVFKLNLI